MRDFVSKKVAALIKSPYNALDDGQRTLFLRLICHITTHRVHDEEIIGTSWRRNFEEAF